MVMVVVVVMVLVMMVVVVLVMMVVVEMKMMENHDIYENDNANHTMMMKTMMLIFISTLK